MENSTPLRRGFEYGVLHFSVKKETSLFAFLTEHEVFTHTLPLENLLALGAIYINNSRNITSIHTPLKAGDHLRVHSKPRRYDIKILQTTQRILYENNDFLIFNKPAGIPVHATVDNQKENVIQALKDLTGRDLFITHRLDIPTSGLIFYAKTLDCQKQFNRLLQEGLVQKTYRAVVHGQNLTNKTLIHYMKRSPRAPKEVFEEKIENGMECKLEILSSIYLKDNQSQLLLKLHTGRTHQIRAQLAKTGHPIVGDQLYGSDILYSDGSIQLECSGLKMQNYNFELATGHQHCSS